MCYISLNCFLLCITYDIYLNQTLIENNDVTVNIENKLSVKCLYNSCFRNLHENFLSSFSPFNII